MQASGATKRPSFTAASDIARCDICGYKDGRNELELIKCTSCSLYVHKQCYGMDTYLHKEFKCWACKAVGRSFQVELKDPDGKRMQILQTSRPSTCALCSYASGVHAMHPLYDAEGKAARQMTLPGDTPQLAWVHSLCAFYLSTQGLLFACSRDGTYDHDSDDDEMPEDNRPNNPELSFEPQDEIGCFFEGTAPVHHFVYYLDKPDHHPYAPFVRAVKRQRHELKCTGCGIWDSDPSQYRIAIQCCAGNDNEHEEFRGKHDDLGVGEACTQGMHVGCANWGRPSEYRRVYYFPGNEKIDPVNAVYCDLHAKDLAKKPSAAGGVTDSKRRPSLQPTKKHSSVSPTIPKRIIPIDNSVLPSLAKRKPSKKAKRQTSAAKTTITSATSAATAVAPAPSVPSGTAQEPSKLPRKRKHTLLDKTEAVAVSNVERSKLTSNPKENAVRHQQLTQLRTDFYDKVVSATSKEERSQILKQKKKYWKERLLNAGISPEEFTKIWQKCKEELVNLITEDQNASTTIDVEQSQPRRVSTGSHESRPLQNLTQVAKSTSNQRKDAPVARAAASPEDTTSSVPELGSESVGSDAENEDNDNTLFADLFVGLGFNRASKDYHITVYEKALSI